MSSVAGALMVTGVTSAEGVNSQVPVMFGLIACDSGGAASDRRNVSAVPSTAVRITSAVGSEDSEPPRFSMNVLLTTLLVMIVERVPEVLETSSSSRLKQMKVLNPDSP